MYIILVCCEVDEKLTSTKYSPQNLLKSGNPSIYNIRELQGRVFILVCVWFLRVMWSSVTKTLKIRCIRINRYPVYKVLHCNHGERWI